MPHFSERPASSFFFKPSFNPYYILAPGYVYSSAGVRCLHNLCHTLNELGCEAYLAPVSALNPMLRTPCLTPTILRNHYSTGRTPIAVYPEITPGNAFHTPYVSRWLLNKPGHLGGSIDFLPNEEIFYFDVWIHDAEIYGNRLTLPVADLSIFNNDNNPFNTQRSGTCYYANKYLGQGYRIPDEISKNSISLCRDIPLNPTEIAEILRRSTALYCFEESSLITEALLCGCPVIMVPTDYMNPDTWNPEMTLPGRGWACEPNVLERLSQEVGQFRLNYETHFHFSLDTVRNFIDHTQNRFTHSDDEAPIEQAPYDEILSFWRVPPAKRKEHLDDFTYACSKLPVFASWSNTEPLFELARWVDNAVLSCRQSIPAEVVPSALKESIETCEPLSPSDEMLLLERTMAYLQEGDYSSALLTLEKLVAHDTLRWDVYETLGQIHAEQNNLAEAAEILLKGASLELSSTHCLRKLAAVYAMMGETWRTLAACAQVLKREPDDAELHLFLRDILVSTSPRFDDISWLAPEWTATVGDFQRQSRAARALLDSLQAKARAVLAGQQQASDC